MIAIAAMSNRRVIGRNGAIPWAIPDELRFFRRITTGHRVVMGRKTFTSIGRPLPKRVNIVLTRDPSFRAPFGVLIVHDPAQILSWPPDDKETFIIGGAEIYRLFLPYCQKLVLTEVCGEYDGDTYFPEFATEFQPAETLEEHPSFRATLWIRKS
jgi:dihydrofolate reductase